MYNIVYYSFSIEACPSTNTPHQRENNNSTLSYHYRIIYSQITPRPTKYTEHEEPGKKMRYHINNVTVEYFSTFQSFMLRRLCHSHNFKRNAQRTLFRFQLNRINSMNTLTWKDSLSKYWNWNWFKFRYWKIEKKIWFIIVTGIDGRKRNYSKWQVGYEQILFTCIFLRITYITN